VRCLENEVSALFFSSQTSKESRIRIEKVALLGVRRFDFRFSEEHVLHSLAQQLMDVEQQENESHNTQRACCQNHLLEERCC
jgi:hypothetical protein